MDQIKIPNVKINSLFIQNNNNIKLTPTCLNSKLGKQMTPRILATTSFLSDQKIKPKKQENIILNTVKKLNYV